MVKGRVYIVRNPLFPTLFKIGVTATVCRGCHSYRPQKMLGPNGDKRLQTAGRHYPERLQAVGPLLITAAFLSSLLPQLEKVRR